MTTFKLMLLLLHFPGGQDITVPENDYLIFNERPDLGVSKKSKPNFLIWWHKIASTVDILQGKKHKGILFKETFTI